MNINEMIAKVKAHPDYSKVGMTLIHNGVVREATREGQGVTDLQISVDHKILDKIIEDARKKKGIVEVLVWIAEGKTLFVGDDIMYLVIAGDIRENVQDALRETLDKIKQTATKKKQSYK
jgi:molybdopterin synthase catalytic subunit